MPDSTLKTARDTIVTNLGNSDGSSPYTYDINVRHGDPLQPQWSGSAQHQDVWVSGAVSVGETGLATAGAKEYRWQITLHGFVSGTESARIGAASNLYADVIRSALGSAPWTLSGTVCTMDEVDATVDDASTVGHDGYGYCRVVFEIMWLDDETGA